MEMRGSAPQNPYKWARRGLDPLTRKNLASKANWPDASLGIELDFWIEREKDDHHPTAPQRGRLKGLQRG